MRAFAIFCLVSLSCVNASFASDFKTTVETWRSHEEVAAWLKREWRFNDAYAKQMSNTIKTKGPSAAVVKSAEETFISPDGWCKDAASFARDALNAIDTNYEAEYIFIKNKNTKAPNHWVTGFRRDGKLYVIDYGAGSHWKSMMGVHGPYNALNEYTDFLGQLDLNNFEVDFVKWMPSEGNNPQQAIARQRAIVVLNKFDKNGDKGISFEEAPPPMKSNFTNLDVNGDNLLNETELRALPPR